MQSTQPTDRPSPGAADLADDLFTLLAYLLKTTQPDLFRALEDVQLSMSQMKLLFTLDLHTDEDCSLSHVGKTLALSLPACSRAVDGLHQRGFVERREDPADRRVKRVRLTDEGRALVRRLNTARFAAIAQFADTLSPADRDRLAAALTPIVAREEIAASRPERTPST
jgi:DNA-binding MarR family transcriptional regulator